MALKAVLGHQAGQERTVGPAGQVVAAKIGWQSKVAFILAIIILMAGFGVAITWFHRRR